jgi:hypothetical protein
MRHPVIAVAILLFAGEQAAGQDVEIRAVRINTPLRIDGRLDEEVYNVAPPVGGVIMKEPDEGEPSTSPRGAGMIIRNDGW